MSFSSVNGEFVFWTVPDEVKKITKESFDYNLIKGVEPTFLNGTNRDEGH